MKEVPEGRTPAAAVPGTQAQSYILVGVPYINKLHLCVDTPTTPQNTVQHSSVLSFASCNIIAIPSTCRYVT